MPEARDASLRLPAIGGVEVSLVRDLLTAIDASYSGYLAFDRIVDGTRRRGRYPEAFWWPDWPLAPLNLLLNDPAGAPLLVYPDERLVLSRVELASPGF